jgi:hypothetical protein
MLDRFCCFYMENWVGIGLHTQDMIEEEHHRDLQG